MFSQISHNCYLQHNLRERSQKRTLQIWQHKSTSNFTIHWIFFDFFSAVSLNLVSSSSKTLPWPHACRSDETQDSMEYEKRGNNNHFWHEQINLKKRICVFSFSSGRILQKQPAELKSTPGKVPPEYQTYLWAWGATAVASILLFYFQMLPLTLWTGSPSLYF